MKTLASFLVLSLLAFTAAAHDEDRVNIGTEANDGSGDTLREAFSKQNVFHDITNQGFADLQARITELEAKTPIAERPADGTPGSPIVEQNPYAAPVEEETGFTLGTRNTWELSIPQPGVWEITIEGSNNSFAATEELSTIQLSLEQTRGGYHYAQWVSEAMQSNQVEPTPFKLTQTVGLEAGTYPLNYIGNAWASPPSQFQAAVDAEEFYVTAKLLVPAVVPDYQDPRTWSMTKATAQVVAGKTTSRGDPIYLMSPYREDASWTDNITLGEVVGTRRYKLSTWVGGAMADGRTISVGIEGGSSVEYTRVQADLTFQFDFQAGSDSVVSGEYVETTFTASSTGNLMLQIGPDGSDHSGEWARPYIEEIVTVFAPGVDGEGRSGQLFTIGDIVFDGGEIIVTTNGGAPVGQSITITEADLTNGAYVYDHGVSENVLFYSDKGSFTVTGQ